MEAFRKNLYTCVVYPGIVENEERMIATLGGLENISLVVSKPNRRLELRYRPDDVFSRPTCADRQKTTGFVLKVKVKRIKRENSNESVDEADNVICEPTVLGRIETTFRFSSLCDFQFLPMAKNENGVTEDIYNVVLPKDFPSLDWMKEEAPHFLPPAIFSRMDSVQPYLYRQEKADLLMDQSQLNIIGRTRRRRSVYAVFVTFDVPSAPSKPRSNALKFLEVKFLAGEPYAKIKELFEKRPIWSRSALIAESKYTLDQVKYLVPAVAYYFVTGPFRVMWVRIGYDPRKDPSSRIYQTLDYRLPNKGGLLNLVKAKRGTDDMPLPYKSAPVHWPRTLGMSQDTHVQKAEDEEMINEPHIFRRGINPPSRQMFYQFCDIQVPEIQEMFSRLPKPAPDAECHRQRGWLPPGFAQHCREIITAILVEQMEKEQSDLHERMKIEMAGRSGEGDDNEEDLYDEEDEYGGNDDSDDEDVNNAYYENDYDDLEDDDNDDEDDDDGNEDLTDKILSRIS